MAFENVKTKLKHVISALGCLLILTGCAQLREQGKNTAGAARISTMPTGPTISDEIAYFPSGTLQGSGLSVEKISPAQVLVGQPYTYTYVVSNLTSAVLENVMVMDRVTSDFSATDSDPAASSMAGGKAIWNLSTLAPNESKTITVKGSSADEGVVTTCGWASYNPVLCQDIHVVRASISLTKTEPANVLICDPIATTLTVKNTGSSSLNDVIVTDILPAGMNIGGKNDATFEADSLAPGDSTNFQYQATATSTGALVNSAKVTCKEGVRAEATATTIVHQPVLAISCNATDQEYIGHKFDVSYTISDTGDAAAPGSKLAVTVPAGLVITSAGTGQVSNGEIDYYLGAVETNAPQTVTATFTSAVAGTFDFAGSVSSACANTASSTCETKVVGTPAILLEKSVNPDPVAVGKMTTYTIKATNQGSTDDSNVRLSVVFDAELAPVNGDQPSASIQGQKVSFPAVPILGAQQALTYKVVAKGMTPGNAHARFYLSSANVTTPISAEEITKVY